MMDEDYLLKIFLWCECRFCKV